MRAPRLALPLLSLATLVACHTPASNPSEPKGDASTSPGKVPDLIGTVWVAIEIDALGTGDAPPALLLGVDGRVVGHGGINRLSGGYTANDAGSLRLEPLVATRMAGPPEQMAVETAFTAALGNVDSYRFEDATLVLIADGENRLRLVAGEEADLR